MGGEEWLARLQVNVANIKNIVPELLAENMIRGRGLFARSCMKARRIVLV